MHVFIIIYFVSALQNPYEICDLTWKDSLFFFKMIANMNEFVDRFLGSPTCFPNDQRTFDIFYMHFNGNNV